MPTRKAPAQAPWARPRRWLGVTRMSRLAAPTLNMIDPAPPTPRRTTNCQYCCANPASRLDSATTPIPPATITRSPSTLTMRPANGAVTRRMNANALITAPAAARLTPNSRANSGSAGATRP